MLQHHIFGCKTNKYYTEKWLESDFFKNKHGVFVASCVVTDQAKHRWISFIKKAANELKEDEFIYLSGCAPIQDGEVIDDFWEKFSEISYLKEKIILLPEAPKDIESININPHTIYTKKFLVVQTGCDNHCTFCLTVRARGKHHSRSLEEIIYEIKDSEKKGGKEVVLTGTNIGAWGCLNTKNNKESQFSKLLEEILKQTSIPRLRISSLGPEYINSDVLEILKNPRINTYLHFSIQSGSSSVLRKMGRNYTREYLDTLFSQINTISTESNRFFNFGADIIVGFPTETDKDFNDTLSLIKNYPISRLHAFPFSDHSHSFGVPAARFENQIKNHIKLSRLRTLLAEGKKIEDIFVSQNIGKNLSVLIEKTDGNSFFGWSQNYLACDTNNFQPTPWQKIEKGSIVEGVYLGATTSENEE